MTAFYIVARGLKALVLAVVTRNRRAAEGGFVVRVPLGGAGSVMEQPTVPTLRARSIAQAGQRARLAPIG